jgi:uncharacterized iron-regulated protein
MMRRLALLLLTFFALATDASAQRIYRLAIGDAARQNREAPVILDTIVDTTTGDQLSPAQFVARVADTRLLLLGESHTAMEFHRAQFQAIKALHQAGRRVMIGLEMYPYTEQRFLDQWVEGLLTEPGFLKLSRWYDNWGYHWQYYRDIFLYARDNRLSLHAVNTPREVVAAVRRKGLTNLTPEEAAHIPTEVDVDSPDHMTYFKASFDEADQLHGGMSDEAWKGMLSAQATWDATMGFNAVQALKKVDDPKAIMVVLVGSGHVAYGVGISRQAQRWFDGKITTFIPVPVRDVDDAPLRAVSATYADFVVGVLAEHDPPFPVLGLSTRAAEGARQVIMVEKDSVAARAGFQVNDVLVSMDGTPLPDRETFNVLMARKDWGDSAVFVVKRGAEQKTLNAVFRRTVAEPPATTKPESKTSSRKPGGQTR